MAEDVLYKNGEIEIPAHAHGEVHPAAGDERRRARAHRRARSNIHLDWYHRHFAYVMLPPPEGEWEPKA